MLTSAFSTMVAPFENDMAKNGRKKMAMRECLWFGFGFHNVSQYGHDVEQAYLADIRKYVTQRGARKLKPQSGRR